MQSLDLQETGLSQITVSMAWTAYDQLLIAVKAHLDSQPVTARDDFMEYFSSRDASLNLEGMPTTRFITDLVASDTWALSGTMLLVLVGRLRSILLVETGREQVVVRLTFHDAATYPTPVGTGHVAADYWCQNPLHFTCIANTTEFLWRKAFEDVGRLWAEDQTPKQQFGSAKANNLVVSQFDLDNDASIKQLLSRGTVADGFIVGATALRNLLISHTDAKDDLSQMVMGNSWVQDLSERMVCMQGWSDSGLPKSRRRAINMASHEDQLAHLLLKATAHDEISLEARMIGVSSGECIDMVVRTLTKLAVEMQEKLEDHDSNMDKAMTLLRRVRRNHTRNDEYLETVSGLLTEGPAKEQSEQAWPESAVDDDIEQKPSTFKSVKGRRS